MAPASIESCRVLELGCGPGVNLIAIAQDFPQSQFTGVDSFPGHAVRGSHIIRALGLQNVSVVQGDIRTFDAGSTRYDYIIAHGVYSWVETDVRDALLRVIRDNLAPQGIAIVSYNTYPGWFMLRAVREMMLFHGRDAADPVDRVAKGTEIVGFLLEHLDPGTNLYAANLAAYRHALEERFGLAEHERIASILHDELSVVNEPVFFHEFMRKVQAADLQYVAEADLRGSTPTGLAPGVVRRIRTLAQDLTSLEQYMDFLLNRTFRQTLLCRSEVPLARTLTSARTALEHLHLSTSASAPDDPGLLQPGVVLRMSAGGAEIATDHVLSKAALLVLAWASPRSCAWDSLVRESASVAKQTPASEDLDVMAATLLRGFMTSRSLVALGTAADRFTTTVSSRPRCAPLVRFLASEGQARVPSKQHERILLDPIAMAIAVHLDGHCSLDDLEGTYQGYRHRIAARESSQGQDGTFETMMERLARSALLEA